MSAVHESIQRHDATIKILQNCRKGTLESVKDSRILPCGNRMIPYLVKDFVHPDDIKHYGQYLLEFFPSEDLERFIELGKVIDLENQIIESVHSLKSLPSRADRTPLLKRLEEKQLLPSLCFDRYFEPGATIHRIDESDFLSPLYGLYESSIFAGTRILLLPDATQSNSKRHCGRIVVLSETSKHCSVGRWTVVEEKGKLVVKRIGASSAFGLVWNPMMDAFDLQFSTEIIQRRTPCFVGLKTTKTSYRDMLGKQREDLHTLMQISERNGYKLVLEKEGKQFRYVPKMNFRTCMNMLPGYLGERTYAMATPKRTYAMATRGKQLEGEDGVVRSDARNPKKLRVVYVLHVQKART